MPPKEAIESEERWRRLQRSRGEAVWSDCILGFGFAIMTTVVRGVWFACQAELEDVLKRNGFTLARSDNVQAAT